MNRVNPGRLQLKCILLTPRLFDSRFNCCFCVVHRLLPNWLRTALVHTRISLNVSGLSAQSFVMPGIPSPLQSVSTLTADTLGLYQPVKGQQDENACDLVHHCHPRTLKDHDVSISAQCLRTCLCSLICFQYYNQFGSILTITDDQRQGRHEANCFIKCRTPSSIQQCIQRVGVVTAQV